MIKKYTQYWDVKIYLFNYVHTYINFEHTCSINFISCMKKSCDFIEKHFRGFFFASYQYTYNIAENRIKQRASFQKVGFSIMHDYTDQRALAFILYPLM